MLPVNFDIESTASKIWLTADLHFGHRSIWTACCRPGESVSDMDEILIHNMQCTVGNDDVLIIVGDFTLFGEENNTYVASMIEKMPGKKILVYGNHDCFKPRWYIDRGFVMASTSLVLTGGILVTHDPADSTVWPDEKPVICGHVHRLFRKLGNVVNVGVDVWDYRPVSLEDVILLAGNTPRKPRNWGGMW